MGKQVKIKDNRKFIKYLLLSIITFGFYEAFMLSNISKEINLISKDGKRTMNYLPLFLMIVSGLLIIAIVYFFVKDLLIIDPDLWSEKDLTTVIKGSLVVIFGLLLIVVVDISIIVWMYRITKRISNELSLRNIDFKFSTETFWCWYFGYIAFYIILSVVYEFLQIEGAWEYVIGLFACVLYYTFMFKMIKAMNFINADYKLKLEE